MILGSHNSWSYLPVKQWWLRPFSFMSRCQQVDIRTQHEKYGVRCFDLRLYCNNGKSIAIAHGLAIYKYGESQIMDDIDWLNDKGDCYVRILHEVRNKKQYNEQNIRRFCSFCQQIEDKYKNTKFWCGRNLYNWEFDYHFKHSPSCEEKYASVCSPKLIDDWYPWLFARTNNKTILSKGTESDILLIDFVNIQ